MRRRLGLMTRQRMAAILGGLLLASGAGAGGRDAADAPENSRLPDDVFRKGLKQLGLSDLLDLYVREYPPDDPIEAALLRRELKLNLYADPTVPSAERLAAAQEASAILEALIRKHPENDMCLSWRLELARDLIERKAEPYYNNILLREGSPEDYHQLSRITAEALGLFDRLVQELDQAEREIDGLSAREFEKLKNTGYIERVELLLPRAEYFSMWARFYHALTLPQDDPQRIRELNEIIHYLTTESNLTSIEHKITHYQAQSLLLIGMAYRLLYSADKAASALNQAVQIAENLPNYTERHNLRWVVIWGNLERIKNARDRGQFERALSILRDYRSRLPSGSIETFHLHFALAQLEGSIYRSQAQAQPPAEQQMRQELLLKSRQPLIELARENPRYQNEIYQSVFEMMGEVDDVSTLDSFEKSVYVAGLLRQANELDGQIGEQQQSGRGTVAKRLQSEKTQILEAAIRVARSLLADESPLARELHPEARFNLAVLHHSLGQSLEAIAAFNEVVRSYPTFDKAFLAADYSVRLAEALYGQAEAAQRPALRPVLLDSLQSLVEHFEEETFARQRRYTYARILQQEGLFERAAGQYGAVEEGDPEHRRALFHVAECNLLTLRQMIGKSNRRDVAVQSQRTLENALYFRERVQNTENELLDKYLAESILISAETNVLRPSPDPDAALEFLSEFEARFVGVPELVGRAMRIRLQCYQLQGRLKEARAILPDYLKRDPENAGATLQSLLKSFKEDIQLALDKGQVQQARQRAEDAVPVARALYEWAASPASGLEPAASLSLSLELGDALLQANRTEEAEAIFAEAVRRDTECYTDGRPRDGRAIYGLAQACYRNHRYHSALKHFSYLYQQTPENTELWWNAFFGELQCRRGLDQDPDILYNLIEQKKSFFPKMGGHRDRFEAYQSELRHAE